MLGKLPVAALVRLLGRDTVKAAESWLGRPPSRAELAGLLKDRYGPLLLAERAVRVELLRLHDDAALRELLSSLRGQSVRIRRRDRLLREVAALPWVRGSRNSHLLARFLNLPEEYAGAAEELPARVEWVPPTRAYNSLFPYQQRLVFSLLEVLGTEARAMLSCYTGTGKTRMGMEVLCRLLGQRDSATVVWAAHKAELLEQAISTLKQLWPHLCRDLGLLIVRYYGGNELPEFESRAHQLNVVFASSQQLVLRLRSGDEQLNRWLGGADLLVVDEAHMALAAGYQDVLAQYERMRGAKHRVLGLSATPGRSDLISASESAALGQLFDGCLVIPDVGDAPLQWFQRHGYLSRIDHQRQHLPSRLPRRLLAQIDSGEDLSGEALERLGRDRQRNLQILRVTRSLVARRRRPLVFCCSVAQAYLLQDLLILAGVSAAAVTGEMDLRDRRYQLQRYHQRELSVLLNVEVLTTGFDIPEVDTLVLCRPTFSGILYEQMVGRGLRGPRVGGTRRCLIVDFTENFERFERPLAWQRWWQAWPKSRLDFLARSAPDDWRVRQA